MADGSDRDQSGWDAFDALTYLDRYIISAVYQADPPHPEADALCMAIADVRADGWDTVTGGDELALSRKAAFVLVVEAAHRMRELGVLAFAGMGDQVTFVADPPDSALIDVSPDLNQAIVRYRQKRRSNFRKSHERVTGPSAEVASLVADFFKGMA